MYYQSVKLMMTQFKEGRNLRSEGRYMRSFKVHPRVLLTTKETKRSLLSQGQIFQCPCPLRCGLDDYMLNFL